MFPIHIYPKLHVVVNSRSEILKDQLFTFLILSCLINECILRLPCQYIQLFLNNYKEDNLTNDVWIVNVKVFFLYLPVAL